MCLHSFPASFNQTDGDNFSQYREQYDTSDVDFFVLLGALHVVPLFLIGFLLDILLFHLFYSTV